MGNFNYFVSDSSITVFAEGKTYTVGDDHPNFNVIKNGLQNRSYIDARDLIADLDQTRELVEAVVDSDVISIEDGVVVYSDENGNRIQIANGLTKRLVYMIKRGINARHLVRFVENLMENPLPSAIMELYEFLDANNLPITGDGCFLAYKKVNNDYKDLYTGRFDNSIGAVVEMPREEVDSNREVTCSNGLHFASQDYMPHYGSSISQGNRIVIVKINPRDVVSFPTDYGNAKGRCCRYEVFAELPTDEHRIRPMYADSKDRAIVDGDFVDDPELDSDELEQGMVDDRRDVNVPIQSDSNLALDYDDDEDEDDWEDDYDGNEW